ncbi:aminoacetone oxidase family FAD-binding enzyme [Mycoplasmatota bacterium]|nr:aminoacetone oxidase family FAD-binding enzyme [Mycoplasmatota bacterium]
MIYQAIIIGGGPAGLMAANVFNENQIKYILLEKNDKVGKKLLITGGGRANVTNTLSVQNFIDELDFKHKKFLYPSLTKFGPLDIIDFFLSKGVKLKLEEPIKYFPETNKSQSVLDALLDSIPENCIHLKENVISIEKDKSLFTIKTNKYAYQSEHIVVATGSKSFPETGSNGDGNAFASKFGIATKSFTPAETSIYGYIDQIPYQSLKGTQIKDSILYINGKKTPFKDDLIFTHFGLSGPLIYKASHRIYNVLKQGKRQISFPLTKMNQSEILAFFDKHKNETKYVKNILSSIIPNKLASYIVDKSNYQEKAFNTLTKKDIQILVEYICDFKVNISHVEDIKRAYVNAGGVDTKSINPNSFQTNQVKNLYFVGEAIDIFGPIGGFNITMALSTAYSAANDIVKKMKLK